MTEKPAYIPTESQLALDAEVERRKAKLLDEGHANELEKNESAVPATPDRIVSVADAIAPAIDVFERLRRSSAAFFEDVREKVKGAPKSIICEKHALERPIDFDLSCHATRRSDLQKFIPAYLPCTACEKEEKDERRRAFWRRRGMPDRVIDANFKNFKASSPEQIDVLTKVKEWFGRSGNFLILAGTTGTGKGHLAAACLRAHGSGIWIEHVNMLGDLRASYTLQNTRDVIERWQEAEMMVLDEFGLSPGGKDEEPLLYQVLADRYDKRRPTIITSNLDKPRLREAIGYRLLDRIREDCTECLLSWPSFRTNK